MAYQYDPDDKFGYKDTLPENHPEKVITGVEFDDEFKKIEAGIGDIELEIEAIVDGGSIPEAPATGLVYGRKDKSWVEVGEAGGGIEEAPETGKPYARKDKAWVESVEKDHTHDIADIDGLQDEIDDLAPIDHTHEIDDVDGLDDALTDLAEKITAVTSDIVFGGTYDLANGVVDRSNKEFLVEGQPLPSASSAPDVFLIVISDGTFEGESLIRSDWIVSDGVTWIPIPYSSSGSVAWDNIVGRPDEFPPADHNHDGDYAPIDHNHDGDYAPADHNHDTDYAPIGHNHDGDYQPVGDYITDAPNDGKPYVRKSEAWEEMPATGGGGDSLWEQNLNDIYYDAGNVGIGTDSPIFTGLDRTTLTINGTASANISFGEGGTGKSYILQDAGGLTIGNQSDTLPTIFANQGDTSMVISSNGNVSHKGILKHQDRGTGSGELRTFHEDDVSYIYSIGSSSAGTIKFNRSMGGTATTSMTIAANGDVSTSENLRIQNKTGGVGAKSELTFVNSDILTGESGRANIVVERVDSGSGGYDSSTMTFSTTIGGVTADFSPRMTIDASGNVGIGVQDQKEALEVAGPVIARGGLIQGHRTDCGVFQHTVGAGHTRIRSYGTNAGEGFITFDVGGGGNLKDTEAMRIDASGNVIIGDTSADFNNDAKTVIRAAGDNWYIKPTVCASFNRTDSDGDILNFYQSTNFVGSIGSSDSGGERVLDINADYTAPSVMRMLTSGSERMRIDASGLVGIGGEPGTRSAGEYLEKAKTQIASWKAELKKRTAEQPEASTQDITLEVTDGDFGVVPTAEALAEKLAERTIGGGDAKLQVSGEIFSNYGFNGPSYYREGYGGFTPSNPDGHVALLPVHADGTVSDAKVSLGSTGYRWKDGYFSGAVNAATINGKVTDVPDHVKAITPTQIANWDAGTGGGGGGATTDGRISDTQIIHWDQAYSWGNHASAGYQPAGNYLTPSSLTGYATESWVNSQGFAKGSFVPTSGNSTISGTLTATDFVATSDARLKQNATTAPVGLVDQLRGVEFEWKEDGRQDAGVIAQEVEKVLPHLVHDTGEHKAVNYNGLVAYLIEEIKDLKKQVQELSK